MFIAPPPAYHLVLQQLPAEHAAHPAQGNLTVAPTEQARPADAQRMGTHGVPRQAGTSEGPGSARAPSPTA